MPDGNIQDTIAHWKSKNHCMYSNNLISCTIWQKENKVLPNSFKYFSCYPHLSLETISDQTYARQHNQLLITHLPKVLPALPLPTTYINRSSRYLTNTIKMRANAQPKETRAVQEIHQHHWFKWERDILFHSALKCWPPIYQCPSVCFWPKIRHLLMTYTFRPCFNPSRWKAGEVGRDWWNGNRQLCRA